MNNLTYFMYSYKQYIQRCDMEKKMNRKYILGKVFINGKIKYFTERRSDLNTLFPDSILIASGNIDKIIYTDPEVIY